MSFGGADGGRTLSVGKQPYVGGGAVDKISPCGIAHTKSGAAAAPSPEAALEPRDSLGSDSSSSLSAEYPPNTPYAVPYIRT